MWWALQWPQRRQWQSWHWASSAPKEAIGGLVDGPSHVVFAPIKGKFSYFLPFLALPRLGRFLFPCLIFLLFLLVRRVLLILFL